MVISDSFAGRAGVVAQGWEMFSRLRYLGKPVEFWAVPNIERGSHTLQNPGQLLTLQERAMDWWLYWLKDEREPSETKRRSEEHTSELQSLMRISYAVFCLKKKTTQINNSTQNLNVETFIGREVHKQYI